MKFAVRIDEEILFFDHVEIFVGEAIPENADLRNRFIHAGALYIEKQIHIPISPLSRFYVLLFSSSRRPNAKSRENARGFFHRSGNARYRIFRKAFFSATFAKMRPTYAKPVIF
jgi:hypothetical protein